MVSLMVSPITYDTKSIPKTGSISGNSRSGKMIDKKRDGGIFGHISIRHRIGNQQAGDSGREHDRRRPCDRFD